MSDLTRFVLTVGVAALLAGCGGSASSPIGTAGALPAGSTREARANNTNYVPMIRTQSLNPSRLCTATLCETKS
jgi:hypothetical protein